MNKQKNTVEKNFVKLKDNLNINQITNTDFSNIEEHQKNITQNINQLIKLDQGKSEILKILESAQDREYYYNVKKRKVLFDNNINKRLQSHNNPPKTIIKTYNPETPEIAIETK